VALYWFGDYCQSLISRLVLVITPGFIEKLDNEGRLIENEYLDFGVTDEEFDNIGEMCDPYEGL